MRKGCLLAAIAFIVVVALFLFATRSLEIERGLSLKSYVAGNFTYDVWSYGNGVESRQSGVYVSTYEPPYTLVLAIQPNGSGVSSIEVLDVFVVDKPGNKTAVLGKIKEPKAAVEYQPTAAIKKPYAAFIIDDVLDSNDPITLEIEFRINTSNGSKKFRQSLGIKGFESKRSSNIIWDIMSGV